MSRHDIAISVKALGKQYRLGNESGGAYYRYKSLRDTLGNLARRPVKTLTSGRGPLTEANSFWALKDVDFEVKKGEVVGIIGRNGAGKSTLLKILSRITKPTEGRIDLYGRVGSLLEVGTGFHPELSGRENVYLNGAILGMTGAEVKSRFDEIVAFSEIEKFLDTPVKQYSSGMYTRLAFAVAAHLQPEILIVDEVLAVGDMEFQKKCLGKMKDIAGQGRTVLFVSHNMPAVKALCTSGCVLHRGEVAFRGEAAEAVNAYSSGVGRLTDEQAFITFDQPPGILTWMKSVEIIADGVRSVTLRSGGTLELIVSYDGNAEIQPVIGLVISSVDGIRVLQSSVRDIGGPPTDTPRRQSGEISFKLVDLRLTAGDYEISLWFGDRGCDHHIVPAALRFTVIASDPFGSGRIHSSDWSYVWASFTASINGLRVDAENLVRRE